ncbi:MAG: SBBP repeat-containing protein, partial [Candidatus Binatales bacterium]
MTRRGDIAFKLGRAGLILAGAAATVLLAVMPGSRPGRSAVSGPIDRTAVADRAAIHDKIEGLPLYFERNAGQTDPQVHFLSRAGAFNLFLTETEAVLLLAQDPALRKPAGAITSAGAAAAPRHESSVLRIKPIGANPNPRIDGLERLPGHVNYLLGDDPSRWRTNIATYARVRYRSIYPGIDLVYYGSRAALEYDLIVAPGADPGRIALAVDGAGEVSVDPAGDLILGTPTGYVTMRKPVIYQETSAGQDAAAGQEVAGVRRQIEGRYAVTDLPGGSGRKAVAIRVAEYDRKRPLVIDPQFVYSTYLGGNGSNKTGTPESFTSIFGIEPSSMPVNFNFSDYTFDIALDSKGNIYVAGVADSPNFPTLKAIQTTDKTTTTTPNAFVAELNPNLSGAASLVYSTYLGGSGDSTSGGADGDEAHGIAVDGSGDAYVAGLTYSNDFPHTAVAFEPTNNAAAANINNGFVTELNFSGGIVYSTFINGSQGAAASRIAVEPGCSSGCAAYVSG